MGVAAPMVGGLPQSGEEQGGGEEGGQGAALGGDLEGISQAEGEGDVCRHHILHRLWRAIHSRDHRMQQKPTAHHPGQTAVGTQQAQQPQAHTRQQPGRKLEGEDVAHHAQPLPEYGRLHEVEEITGKATRQHVVPETAPGGQVGGGAPGSRRRPQRQVEQRQQSDQPHQEQRRPAARRGEQCGHPPEDGEEPQPTHEDEGGVVGDAQAEGEDEEGQHARNVPRGGFLA